MAISISVQNRVGGENEERLTGPREATGIWFAEREITWAPSDEQLAYITFHGNANNPTITGPNRQNPVEIPAIAGTHRTSSWFDTDCVKMFSV